METVKKEKGGEAALRPEFAKLLPLWLFRGVALFACFLLFFPPANPGRISEKINASASLFTTAFSYGTITNSMGRILRDQWIRDADIRLLMAACAVMILGTVLCGVGACMGCSMRTKDGFKRICKDGPILKHSEILWSVE